MVEKLRFSKMRVNLYHTRRRYIVESSNLFLLTNIESAIINYFLRNVAHFLHTFISGFGHFTRNTLKITKFTGKQNIQHCV
jgi:hypothetical protein